MSPARTLRGVLAPLVALGLCLLAPGRAAAQERITVFTEPGTPVVATEVLIAAGAIDERDDQAGLAYLAARAVTEPIRAQLDSLGAHLTVQPHKDALSFTLIVAPDAWEAATRVLFVSLFHDPPSAAAVARERRVIREELIGREDNPADALARQIDGAYFGPDHPWARPAVGSIEALARLEVGDVDFFLRRSVTPERAVVVVVGPVEAEYARGHLGLFLDPAGSARYQPPPPPHPARSPVRADYNSITTWVSAIFPFRATADEEALRLLAHLVEEALRAEPGRHVVYNVRSEVIPRLGGGELRFQLVIPPQQAEEWAERITRTVREVAEHPHLTSRWGAVLRRYRGERLQSLAAPEARAREAARRLLVDPDAAWLLPEFDGLTVSRLQAAVRSLGEPTVVYLGPLLDDR